jgi:hypothetical protein
LLQQFATVAAKSFKPENYIIHPVFIAFETAVFTAFPGGKFPPFKNTFGTSIAFPNLRSVN